MAEVVNLRNVKKRLARAKNAAQGTENAIRFGQNKAQRKAEQAEAARARATLDAHRRAP